MIRLSKIRVYNAKTGMLKRIEHANGKVQWVVVSGKLAKPA